MKQNKGFTLIELLVVVSIIGFIASISVVSLNSARRGGRDARRIQDINNLQTALSLYFDTYNSYPNCWDPGYPGGCDYIDSSGGRADSSNDGVFMHFLVTAGYISADPKDPGRASAASLPSYVYGTNTQYPLSSGIRYNYMLGAILEDPGNAALSSSITYGDSSLPNSYVLGERR